MGLISFTRKYRDKLVELWDECEDMLTMIFYIFLAFVIVVLPILPIAVSVLIFNRVMHVGHPTSFSPPDSRSGFTTGPDSRGTINIVWACLSTIFTCVYVSLHLDVPFRKGQPQGWRQKIWSWMMSVRRKAIWIIINLLAPEFVVFVAIREFFSARTGMIKVRVILNNRGAGNKKWTLAHAFFADMGGFKVRRLVVPSRSSSPETKAAERADTGAEKELTRPRSSESGENVVEKAQEAKPETPLQSDARADAGMDTEAAWMPFSKPADDIVLRSGEDFYKWLDKNPEATKSIDYEQVGLDIQDKSKADSLLKTLTILQASWLVVQTIARAVNKQPVSELEVSTCAYVACTLITYSFWWRKPYGVQKHILLHVPFSHDPGYQDTISTPFKFSRMNGDDTDGLIATIASGCIGAVIGAIHCTLWNATFANSNGQLLWRICSIAQVVAPVAMLLFLVLLFVFGSNSDRLGNCLIVSSLFSCFIQFCARIVLFILVGYSFWSLPSGVYKNTDWTWSWFPHIG